MLADMHTHSEYSHDSVAKIEDICQAQIDAGTEIFAVTDHFDTDSLTDYDVFTPIKKAYDTVALLKGKYNVLSGVEISEGFWHPDACAKIIRLCDYDVIIGSVHLVRYKDLTMAYSKIDFSALDIQTVYEYLDSYFDDLLTMLDAMDFDILAHLTCPLRYIVGKYNIDISIDRYILKIEKILKTIIDKNIALEINTSSYSVLGDFMPGIDIIRKYYNMGGRLITLGSDAHVPQNVSQNFDKAILALKKIGFDSVYYYKNRKPYKLPL